MARKKTTTTTTVVTETVEEPSRLQPMHYALVVDASGSMAHLTDDVVGGINAFIQKARQDMRALGIPARITLNCFDTNIKFLHRAAPIESVPTFTRQDYTMGGGTALFDAVGATIRDVETAKIQTSKVMLVIQTDGQENSSGHWNSTTIKELIRGKEAQGWDILFLGANLEAWTNVERLGTHNNFRYNNTPIGTRSVFAAAAATGTSYYTLLAGAPVNQTMTQNMQAYYEQSLAAAEDKILNTPPEA